MKKIFILNLIFLQLLVSQAFSQVADSYYLPQNITYDRPILLFVKRTIIATHTQYHILTNKLR